MQRPCDMSQANAAKEAHCPDAPWCGLALASVDKRFHDREEDRKLFILGRMAKTGVPASYRKAEVSTPWGRTWADSKVPGLYIWGGTGVGKTYEASAIILHLAKRWLFQQPTLHVGGMPRSYMPFRLTTLGAILDQTRKTGVTRDEVLEDYNRVQVLCLDDLGKEKASDYTLETLYRIIDGRIANGLRTIITSNLSPAEAVTALNAEDAGKAVPDAILSRMQQYATVNYIGPDRRR